MDNIIIQAHANRKLSKKTVDIGNMQENKVTKLIFELDEDIVALGGNVYLFVSYDGDTYPYPLTDNTVEIGRELTQRSKTPANLVVSTSEDPENILSDVVWISNTLTLLVDKNSINIDSINEQELPPSLQIVYDRLLNLEKDLQEKKDSDYWRGAKGDKGDQGEKGDAFTYEDFSQEQLEALKVKGDPGEQGPKGDTGATGASGKDGVNGADGKSAYDHAVDGGYTDSEEVFNESLAHAAELEAYKANSILCKASGTTILTTDSANVKPKNIKLCGKSTQDGTPSIETPIEAEPLGKSGSIKHRLLTSNLLNPNACNRSIPCTVVNSTTFQWITTDVDLVQGKTYYTGYSINGVYGHYLHYINYDVESSSKGAVTKVTDGVFVAKRSGKLCFRADASGGATIDNLFISEVYVEEFEPYTEQPFTFQTPNGLHGIPLGTTIPYAIKNSPIHLAGVYWDEKEGQYYIADYRSSKNKQNVQVIGENVLKGDITYYPGVVTDNYNSFFSYEKLNLLHTYKGTVDCYMEPVLSTHFIKKTSRTEDGDGIIAGISNKYLYFYVPKTDFPDADTFKAYVKAQYDAGTPITSYFVLAEPIVTDLTEEEMAQYDSLVMNYPNTTIVNDANAYMEVEYVADTKCYIDKKFKELEANVTSAIAQLL